MVFKADDSLYVTAKHTAQSTETLNVHTHTHVHTWFGVHFRLSIGQRGPVSLQKTRDIERDDTRWYICTQLRELWLNLD